MHRKKGGKLLPLCFKMMWLFFFLKRWMKGGMEPRGDNRLVDKMFLQRRQQGFKQRLYEKVIEGGGSLRLSSDTVGSCQLSTEQKAPGVDDEPHKRKTSALFEF